jgi:hypothetical protein
MTPKARSNEHLERRLARVAREQGLDQERLRRWVSFLALCGLLEKAMSEGVVKSYYLKGGVALELRFAMRARATKDLDVGIDGPREGRLALLQQAIRLGFDEFTFRAKPETRDMEQADTVRIAVAVEYRSRAWQTIEVDLGPARTPAIDLIEPQVQGLMELGLPVTSPVRCLGLAEQVAQKLHACTSPHSRGRLRDVLDILLIEMLGTLDYARTAAAARRIFLERGTYAFPPVFTVPDHWRGELETMAEELGLSCTRAADIEKRFRAVIEDLAVMSK